MRYSSPKCFLVLSALFLCQTLFAIGDQEIKNEAFTLSPHRYGLASLQNTNDSFPTNYIDHERTFGDVSIRYIFQQQADSLQASIQGKTVFCQEGVSVQEWQSPAYDKQPLQLAEEFNLHGHELTWKIRLQNTSDEAIQVEDLAIPINYQAPYGEDLHDIFEGSVVKHHFISGNNSFLFFERPTGLAPYLVMLPLEGTSPEYWKTGPFGREKQPSFQLYLHSAFTGNNELRGDWRQPHSSLFLQPGQAQSYGFKFRWANSYDDIRAILVEEGLIDVQVMPGMTVPTDLDVRIALNTRQEIHAIQPEFGGKATQVEKLETKADGTQLYQIRFNRLGENKITISYGDNAKTYLEFFVTEPLETLYKKRAAFLVHAQQHRDSTKWYDGLFGIYDMKNSELRGPDNPDYFDQSRLRYVLTCDDPALCKAPFLAAKNVVYPEADEIEAIEYYLEHFVWGKLQRTDQELPYPYGIYGTPDWPTNRDTKTREANTDDPNRFKMHVWRSYDYPHLMMLYYHMYEIASMYPNKVHYLDAEGYLIRAKETAKAYFSYPYEILPWYETYKWGCYNELLIPELIAVLQSKGYTDDAEFLTQEWEKKAKYFIYDDPYPFRSEYAVDATAFESSYALAKYGVLNEMKADSNLWFDKNKKRWYSHPRVSQQAAADFMQRQLEANIALRGALEPAYYFLGSDFRGQSDAYCLSYMAQMGGWAILDYALQFAPDPDFCIRLGYQSYLSSFALMNTGTADSNYGFWYPGKENDGASGWAFKPQQYGNTWIQKPQGRGPWFYDGEIDLGYSGALRMAATVVTTDSIFGNVAYGGKLAPNSPHYDLVIPKDGLRKRLFWRKDGLSFDLILERDGFRKDDYIRVDEQASQLSFNLENRSGDRHHTTIQVDGLSGNYQLKVDGKKVQTVNFSTTKTVEIPVRTNAFTEVQLLKL